MSASEMSIEVVDNLIIAPQTSDSKNNLLSSNSREQESMYSLASSFFFLKLHSRSQPSSHYLKGLLGGYSLRI